jgi:signal peptidase I
MSTSRTRFKIALIIVGLFVVAIVVFVVWLRRQPIVFLETSEIMAPTIKSGEVVTGEISGFQRVFPRRWEVVVFFPPSTNGHKEVEFWCMRVVGLPGERIHIREDGIYIDGKRQDQPEHISHIRYAPTIEGLTSKVSYPYEIPVNSYFLVGDNTTNSFDSRFWGPLSGSRIVGRVKGK